MSKSLKYIIEQKSSVSNETLLVYCKTHQRTFMKSKAQFADVLETKKGDTSIFHLLFDCTEASDEKCDAKYQVT